VKPSDFGKKLAVSLLGIRHPTVVLVDSTLEDDFVEAFDANICPIGHCPPPVQPGEMSCIRVWHSVGWKYSCAKGHRPEESAGRRFPKVSDPFCPLSEVDGGSKYGIDKRVGLKVSNLDALLVESPLVVVVQECDIR
jgi:hypothetical protein